MDKKRLIAALVAFVLGAAGLYFGIDFKAAVCGSSAPAAEQAK